MTIINCHRVSEEGVVGEKEDGWCDNTPPPSPSDLKLSAALEHDESGNLDAKALQAVPEFLPLRPKSKTHLSKAAHQWQHAACCVMEANITDRDLRAVRNSETLPADRLFAAFRLQMLIHKHPGRTLLVEACRRRSLGAHTSLWQRLGDEILVTGELCFLWFVPAKMGNHWPLFSTALTAAILTTFFFMAGEYPLHQAQYGCTPPLLPLLPPATPALADLAQYVPHLGPRHLLATLHRRWPSPACARDPTAAPAHGAFSASFLVLWGAQWAPLIAHGQHWRWWSMQFVHVSFGHLWANLLLLALLAFPIERKYGTWRVALLWSLAVFGGNLMNVATDDPCKVVAGASGGLYGLVGLYAADLLRNYKTVRRPLLQGAAVLALLVWLARLAADPAVGISNMTHVGGLIWGLFPGLLFLNVGKPKWELVEAWVTVLGAVGFAVLATVMPVFVYTRELPRVRELCGV